MSIATTPLLFSDEALAASNAATDLSACPPENCAKCKRCQTYGRPARGFGNKSARIMFVLERPDEADVIHKRSGCGETRDRLIRVLNRVGLHIDDVYVTYGVRCWTKKAPTQGEANVCSRYLSRELNALRPEIVVVASSQTLKALCEDKSANMSKQHGTVVTLSTFPGTYFIPVKTFDAVYENINNEVQMVNDITRGIAWVNNKDKPRVHTDYVTLDSMDKIRTFLRMAEAYDTFALDIETNGAPSFWTTKVACWAVAWAPGKAAVVPWVNDKGEHVWTPEERLEITSKWRSVFSKKKLVLHNGKYDLKVLRSDLKLDSGIYFFDTMLAAYIIDEIHGTAALKSLAWLYSDMGGYDDALDEYRKAAGIGHDYSKIPGHILWPYNCADADCTFRMYLQQQQVLEKENKTFLMHALLMPLAKNFMEVEYRGVKIDKKYLEGLRATYEADIADLTAKIHEQAGEEFNIQSTPALSDILFNKLKLPKIKLDKYADDEDDDGMSTDKDALGRLYGKHPIVELLMAYRIKTKLLGGYINSMLKRADQDDYIHTEYGVATRTGRINSRNPNLQTLPKDNEDKRSDLLSRPGKEIKRAFIARPGYILYEFDYSQVEVRVMAHVSGDERLVSDLKTGLDIHRKMASSIFGVDFDKVTDQQRSNSKSAVFGIIYGMHFKTLAEKKGISVADAEQVYNNFFNTYTGVAKWIEDVKDFARKHKYVMSPFNRVRHLDAIDHPNNRLKSKSERCAVNSPIQATGADIPNLGINSVLDQLRPPEWDYRLIMQVHDAAYFEISEKCHEAIAPKIKDILENAWPLIVPTPVEAKRGYNLGDVSKVKL